jgi:hypothetical protein
MPGNPVFPMTRSAGCPSDLDLERALRGERIPATSHIETCPLCTPRLAAMRELGEHFTARVFPRLRERITPKPAFSWAWLAPALVPVAAAALLFAFWPRPPPADYVGLKGGGPAPALLEVYVGEGREGRRLATGEQVHPGDGLRFVVTSPSATAFVFTVDATGRVSRLYPSDGPGPAQVDGLLPGGAILDDVTGPERVFAVYPRGAMTFSEVEAAVAAAYTGADQVRQLDRLPLDAPQQSVLLEKVPR